MEINIFDFFPTNDFKICKQNKYVNKTNINKHLVRLFSQKTITSLYMHETETVRQRQFNNKLIIDNFIHLKCKTLLKIAN